MSRAELVSRSRETTADQLVSVVSLLRQIGTMVPDVEFGSVKVYCPFSILHMDHGTTRSMRVYPESNTAYCFNDCGFFTPTKLAMQAWDLSRAEAVDRLLETVEQETDNRLDNLFPVGTNPPSTEALSEALRVYCQRLDGWPEREFKESVIRKLEQCLALLPGVVSNTEAGQWLDACKVVMGRAVLGEYE